MVVVEAARGFERASSGVALAPPNLGRSSRAMLGTFPKLARSSRVFEAGREIDRGILVIANLFRPSRGLDLGSSGMAPVVRMSALMRRLPGVLSRAECAGTGLNELVWEGYEGRRRRGRRRCVYWRSERMGRGTCVYGGGRK